MARPKHDVDRGFAWIILVACFTMYLTVGGPNKTYGVLYAELLEYFDSGSGNTAWIGSICSILSHCLGPVSNYLTRRFSFRTVTLIGGFLYGLGHILTGLVSRMEYMFFTYGILCGFGLGLSVPPTITVLNFYFDKRRSFANGIVISASGVGAFVYPFFYRFLIKTYGLQGALWILGAVFLHSCVGACILREPADNVEKELLRSLSNISLNDAEHHKPKASIECNESLLSHTEEARNEVTVPNLLLKHDARDAQSCHGDHLAVPSPRFRRKDILQLYASDSIEAIAMSSSMRSLEFKRKDKPTVHNREIEYETQTTHAGNTQPTKRFSNASSVGQVGKRICYACCNHLPNFKISLFLNPRFTLHVIAIMLCTCAYSSIQMIIPAHVAHMGFSMDNAAMCISIMGACDLVCRLFVGWFADRKWIQRKHIVIFNVTVIGTLCFIVPKVSGLTLFRMYSGITGALLGTIWSLSPALIVDVVGMEDFSQAFGLLVLGIGCAFVAQPIAGWLQDFTGNWHASFYFTGAMLFVSVGAVILDMIILKLWERKKENKKENEEA